jgi:uncharacterized membrane protein YoaT (DUF817 family)
MKKDIALPAAIYILCVVLVSLLWHRPIVLLACCLTASIFMLYQWHDRSDVIFYGVAFVLGPVAEALAVHFGAWQYSEPLYYLPIWLPFLWGIVALFLKKISESLAGTTDTSHSRKGDDNIRAA